MKILSLVLGAAVMATAGCASLKVEAARISKDGAGNHVRLENGPCTSTTGVLASIPPNIRKVLKAASVYWQGKNFAACYMEHPDRVVIVDESGDGGEMELKQFTRETEI